MFEPREKRLCLRLERSERRGREARERRRRKYRRARGAKFEFMKTPYVSDLKDGQPVEGLFLVCEKEIRTSARSSASWLQVELGDRTGSISAKMWENFAPLAETFEAGDVVRIRGRAKLYNNQLEVSLDQIIPVAENAYDLNDFLPATKYYVEALYWGLRSAIASMKTPWLKHLLSIFV